ncbi:MAG: phosphate acyltransferase PlsX [Armatimonadetes bacterium]|nr:phosphate acyltransferase PlsX [Armatimonadota bacterium]
MGGDHAPNEIVAGALLAAPQIQGTITLVGNADSITPLLPKPTPPQIAIVPASQVIEMDESPVEAIRRKRDSSLMVAVELVKAGSADAMISAGNTGAATAASLLAWRTMPGVHRPAIAALFPNKHREFVLLDAGASPDVDPSHMVEFAQMGLVYARTMLGRTDPKVHLLNIGEEDSKGNSFAKQAHKLLSHHAWFGGNIEGKDMFRQHVDVVVCDAFVGNIVLKTSEGVAEFLMSSIRDALPDNPIAKLPYLPLRSLFAPIRKKVDYAEYGGMPLLGLNGLTFICHGRSSAKAIKNALLFAQRAVKGQLLDKMRESMAAPGRESRK